MHELDESRAQYPFSFKVESNSLIVSCFVSVLEISAPTKIEFVSFIVTFSQYLPAFKLIFSFWELDE